MESNDTDEVIDEANEYPILFAFILDSGLATENELQFNGNKELAKQYEEREAAAALIDLSNAVELTEDIISERADKDMTIIEGNQEILGSKSEIILKHFSLPSYAPPKLEITTFLRPREPRIKYLLRSIKLWQEFRNTFDMDRLLILFNDIFTKDCLLFMHSSTPPLIGPQRIHQQACSMTQHVPDICVFFNEIVRTKKRVITFKCNTFGTLPYANASDKSTWTWNIFEYMPLDKLDEYHKVQKQKYDTLKNQNKVLRFEQRCTWILLIYIKMNN